MSVPRPAFRAALALAAAVALAPAPPPARPAGDELPGFESSVYTVPAGSTRLALRDFDRDGRRDLLAIDVDGFALHRFDEHGRLLTEAARCAWPAETVGWCLADMDGDGDDDIVLLIDGRRVVVVRPDAEGALTAGPELLDDSSGFLPRGIRRVNFVRDVDGDGRNDIVVPGAGRFQIHLRRGEGWSKPVPVSYQARIDLDLGDPARLDGRLGQEVRIPWFTLEDIDGDGYRDLVSQTSDEAAFHLARPELPDAPTWRLDLASVRELLDRPARIDLDNLLANVDAQVNWKVADIDGVPPHDFVLQSGGTFSLFLGGSTGPRFDAPDQVLKASGNVLYFLLRDVNADGRKDLQILRAQSISLGDALRMLIVPGSVDFDVFTYVNEGAAFSRKPSARTTISLRVPALLGFIDTLEEMEQDYEKRLEVPARAAALDGDGLANDIVDVVDGSIAIWRDAVPSTLTQTPLERFRSFDVDDLLEVYATARLDHLGDGGTLLIGLEDIRELLVTPGWDLRQARKGREPDASVPLAVPDHRLRMRVEDLDGDGVDDIVVTGRDADRNQRVQFLISR